MNTKMFSVAVSIGGRIDPSLGGAIGKSVSMFKGMSRGLEAEAKRQRAILGEMRTAAGTALAGLGLGHGIGQAISAGADFNKEVIALKNAGRTTEEVAQGIAKATATAFKLPTTTFAENLKLLNETTGAFGDFHHALENLDFNAKLSSVMQSSFGDKLGNPGEAFNKIVRAFEIRGTAADPKTYQKEMGGLYQAMAFTRGNVNPDQFLNFAQRANPAVRYLDESFLTRIAPSLIQEFGGDIAGTGLTAFRKVIRGGVSDSIQAKEWVRLGLVDQSKVRLNKAGQVQGWSSGAVKGTDLAFSNPLKFMEDIVLPAIAKKGININDEFALGKELDVLYKNSKSNAFAAAIGQMKSRARLHKDAGLIDMVPTMDKAYENNMDDVKTGVFAVKNAFENLFASLSGPLLAPASHALVALATGVQRVAVALKEHPTLGAGFGITAAAASGVAGLTILRSSLSMLGLAGFGPIRLLKAELFSLAATASGAVAGSIRLIGTTFLTLLNPLRLVRFSLVTMRGALIATGIGAALVGIAAAGTFIANNWNGIGRFFTEFGAAFTAALGPETTAKIQPILDFGGKLLGIFQSVTGEISADKWAKWGAAAGLATADALKWVEALPARLPGLASDFATGMTSLAGRGAKALADYDWKALGVSIVDGIISGIASMGEALAAKLSSIAGDAWSGVKSKFGLGPAVVPAAANDNPRPSMPSVAGGSLPAVQNKFSGWKGGGVGGMPWTGEARAAGGPVTGGTPYLVGERGPEIVVPRASGAVIPNHMLGAKAGGVNPALLKMIDRASAIAGVPLSIESGFRSIAHNRAVGGAGHSMHTQGLATDLRSPGHVKNEPAFWARINGAMRQAAAEQGQAYRWGGTFGGKYAGDWNHFDLGHGGGGGGGAAVARTLGGRARGYARAQFGKAPGQGGGAPAPSLAPPAAMAALAAAQGGGGSTRRNRYQGGNINVEVVVNGAGGSPDEVGRQVAYEVRRVLAQYESEQRGMLSD